MVDLAGSEGVSKTQADGMRLREGSNINKSLLALSNVINKLSSETKVKQFINYRDSKLTRILQKSISGNASTAIICTITQLKSSYQETLSTLGFGSKAKKVKTTVSINEIQQGNGELLEAQQTIKELRDKLHQLEIKQLQYGTPMEVDQTSKGITEISVQALKEQIRFMTEKFLRMTEEMSEKEQIIQAIELEKRQLLRKLEQAEMAQQHIEDDGIRLMNLDASFSDLRESLDPSNRESLSL